MTEMNDKLWNEIEKLRREVERLRTLEGGGGGTAQTLSGARVSRSTEFSIPNNSVTAIQWTNEDWDTDGYVDLATDNTVLTVPFSGVYRIFASFDFSGNATGIRAVHLYKNGVQIGNIGFNPLGSAATSCPLPMTEHLFAVNDEIVIKAYQNSGVALNIITTYAKPFFGIEYAGPIL